MGFFSSITSSFFKPTKSEPKKANLDEFTIEKEFEKYEKELNMDMKEVENKINSKRKNIEKNTTSDLNKKLDDMLKKL